MLEKVQDSFAYVLYLWFPVSMSIIIDYYWLFYIFHAFSIMILYSILCYCTYNSNVCWRKLWSKSVVTLVNGYWKCDGFRSVDSCVPPLETTAKTVELFLFFDNNRPTLNYGFDKNREKPPEIVNNYTHICTQIFIFVRGFTRLVVQRIFDVLSVPFLGLS